MKAIISNKIHSARILKGFSQQKLAEETGISKQMVSKYEKGKSIPSSTVLIQLAKILGVQLDYFFSESAVDIGVVNFRKKSKLSQRRLNAIKEEVSYKLSHYLEIEAILQIDSVFDRPIQECKVNAIKDVQNLVPSLRENWEIGLDPIHNITQLLEDQKIKVIEVVEEENLFDGLATLVGEKYAVIVINKNFPIERKRFTLLHELGHLILDLPHCNRKEEENYCNGFAAEFLFPTESVIEEFGESRKAISVKELIEMQKKYGISIQAVFYRLVDAGIVSPWRQKQFYKRMNTHSELKELINKERFETPEFSRRFEQLVYRAYSQQLISAHKAASFLGKNVNKILEKEMV